MMILVDRKSNLSVTIKHSTFYNKILDNTAHVTRERDNFKLLVAWLPNINSLEIDNNETIVHLHTGINEESVISLNWIGIEDRIVSYIKEFYNL